MTTICLEDFCGTDEHGIPVQFWADYETSTKTVVFGGDWRFVPDYKVKRKPTNKQIKRWVNYHLEMM